METVEVDLSQYEFHREYEKTYPTDGGKEDAADSAKNLEQPSKNVEEKASTGVDMNALLAALSQMNPNFSSHLQDQKANISSQQQQRDARMSHKMEVQNANIASPLDQ